MIVYTIHNTRNAIKRQGWSVGGESIGDVLLIRGLPGWWARDDGRHARRRGAGAGATAELTRGPSRGTPVQIPVPACAPYISRIARDCSSTASS